MTVPNPKTYFIQTLLVSCDIGLGSVERFIDHSINIPSKEGDLQPVINIQYFHHVSLELLF
jgi:hypothetical protein